MFFDQLCSIEPKPSTLSAEEKDGMVYVNCNYYWKTLTPQQLSTLFTPQTERLEYLVMRQIIREHDAACGHPGLRLVAEDVKWEGYLPPDGYRITFSLLAQSHDAAD